MQNFSIKITDLPSLYQEPKITSTIKENPFKNNVEVEGGEKILKSDLSAIYQAVGKKHSKGGMDVYLPPESFVFSDFKDLAISPEEHDTFELKKGSDKLQNNTPAKVIARNIDTKHYNKMTSILNDVKKTEFDKRTAMLMLNKYEDTLGKVAYIQESKKNFPDGLPDFAKDTAPVFDTELKNEIMENKQYMKWGGKTLMQKSGNPFGKDYVNDLVPSNDYNDLSDPFKQKLGNGFNPIVNSNNIAYKKDLSLNPYLGDSTWKGNASKYSKDEIVNKLQSIGYNGPRDVLSAQHWLNTNPNFNQLVKKYHSTGPGGFGPTNSGEIEDNNWGHRWDNILDDAIKWNNNFKEPPIPNEPFKDTPPEVGSLYTPPKKPYNQNYGWTNDMKRSTALDAFNAASIEKGQVYRPQIKSSLVELEKVNPQAALNNVNNAAYRSSQNLRGINPFLATGQNANIYGQSLDNVNQVQNQYDNQNVQIGNQQNLQNNQIQNNDARTNIGFDNQFFKENELNKAHFSNAKQFAWNKVNEDVNSNNRQVDQIRYFNGALSPNSPYSLSLGDNGRYNPIDNPNRDIMAVNNPYSQQNYFEKEYAKFIKLGTDSGMTPGEAAKNATNLLKAKGLFTLPQNTQYPQQQTPQKKGGKIKNNPFK